jgi:RNA polymerase sigma-70 factor (ECF subfamily)
MEDEKILIKKAQKGDKQAYGEIYKKYFQKIYRYCKFNTNNEELAKDICQESFVKAWKKIKDFKTEGQWSIQAFLFTIARNLIIDFSRKKKEYALDQAENVAAITDLYEDLDKKNEIEQVRNALSKLDDLERQIIILRYFEEMPSAEVAKILNVNDGALRVRTYRVMQKLKDIFEALYGKRN